MTSMFLPLFLLLSLLLVTNWLIIIGGNLCIFFLGDDSFLFFFVTFVLSSLLLWWWLHTHKHIRNLKCDNNGKWSCNFNSNKKKEKKTFEKSLNRQIKDSQTCHKFTHTHTQSLLSSNETKKQKKKSVINMQKTFLSIYEKK